MAIGWNDIEDRRAAARAMADGAAAGAVKPPGRA
jgi:hypothetical protein